ncbi:MAG: hypothetical protein ACYTEW_13515 [Planctomycetota bacterium]
MNQKSVVRVEFGGQYGGIGTTTADVNYKTSLDSRGVEDISGRVCTGKVGDQRACEENCN